MLERSVTPEEIAAWLNRRVPAEVWQRSGVVAHVDGMIAETFQKAAGARSPRQAHEWLRAAFRWVHVRKALNEKLTSGHVAAWRLDSAAVAKALSKWGHQSEEARLRSLHALVDEPSSWHEVAEGEGVLPSDSELEGMIPPVSVRQFEGKKGPSGPLMALIGVAAVVLGLVVGAGAMWLLQPGAQAAPAPTAGTLAVSPFPTFLQPTQSPSPPPTTAPSPTAVSVYRYAPVSWLTPPLPQGFQPMFVLDDSRAVLSPSQGWKKAPGGIGNQHLYWDTPVAAGQQVTVRWQMDVPWPEAGAFQLFALDPLSQGGGVDLTYQVLVNGAPVAPVAGTGVVHQVSGAEGQRSDAWKNVGIYYLPEGAQVAVVLNLAGFHGVPMRKVAGVDAIAWAAMNLPTVQKYPPAQQIRGEIAYWQDDTQAVFKPAGKWLSMPPSPENFGGARRIQSKSMGSAEAKWTFSQILPGHYQLCVWIPPTNATLRWTVTAGQHTRWRFDKKNLPDPLTADTLQFKGSDFKHFVCLGTLDVQQMETVSIRLQGKGNLIADAVFLLARSMPTPTPTATTPPTPTPTPVATATTASPTATPTPTPTPTPSSLPASPTPSS